MMKKHRGKIIVAASLIVLGAVGLWRYCTKDYHDDFLRDKGNLVRTRVVPASEDSLRSKSWLTLTGDAGLTVECGMLVPHEKPKRCPAIILLGGKATGKYAVHYVPEIEGVIVVAVDYPYSPRESYTLGEFVEDVPAIRRALMAMIPSVMLVMDYLTTQPDVDSTKIVVLGYSFGAPFVPCILANDRRPAAAAMVFGGGELTSLIERNVRRYESAAVSKFVGSLGGFLLAPLEPLRYADRISPVPFIMINGTDDEMIPRENVELVYERAKEPRKLIWLGSQHVRPDNVKLTQQIVDTLQEEFRRLQILPRE